MVYQKSTSRNRDFSIWEALACSLAFHAVYLAAFITAADWNV